MIHGLGRKKELTVSVHSRQLPHMRKHVLQPVRQLEGIHVPQPELHMRIHNQLCQSQDLSTEMKGVSESRLFSLLGSERLDRFQVQVVIEVQVVQVLSVDKEVEHVVALSTDLKTCFYPVERCCLEEFGVLERSEKVSLSHCFWSLGMQSIENIRFELNVSLYFLGKWLAHQFLV